MAGGASDTAGEALAGAASSECSEAGENEDVAGAGQPQATVAAAGQSLAQLSLSEQQRRAAVTATLTEQQRKAARRAAMSSLSRNAAKSKNKGKRPGADASLGGGGW